jgi:hypothetical protein
VVTDGGDWQLVQLEQELWEPVQLELGRQLDQDPWESVPFEQELWEPVQLELAVGIGAVETSAVGTDSWNRSRGNR